MIQHAFLRHEPDIQNSIDQFTSLFTLQTSNYVVIIDVHVDSKSLTMSFKKCMLNNSSLASLCIRSGWTKPYLVTTSEDKFLRDKPQLIWLNINTKL